MNITAPVSEDFELYPQLATDTIEVDRWDCCRVLLMNDANYPWLVLVPRREGLAELHDLDSTDWLTCMSEIARASRTLQCLVGAHKMNVAALGNVTRQLHIHVIARFAVDAAWPKPVWGQVPAEPYGKAALAERVEEMTRALNGNP